MPPRRTTRGERGADERAEEEPRPEKSEGGRGSEGRPGEVSTSGGALDRDEIERLRRRLYERFHRP